MHGCAREALLNAAHALCTPMHTSKRLYSAKETYDFIAIDSHIFNQYTYQPAPTIAREALLNAAHALCPPMHTSSLHIDIFNEYPYQLNMSTCSVLIEYVYI